MLTETERASLSAIFDSILTRTGRDGVKEVQQLLRSRARKRKPGRPPLPRVIPWSIFKMVEDLRKTGITIKAACDKLASCKFQVLCSPVTERIMSVIMIESDDQMEQLKPLPGDLTREWVPPNPRRLSDLYYWGRELARPVRASTKPAKNRLNLVAAGCVLASSSHEIYQKTAIHLFESN